MDGRAVLDHLVGVLDSRAEPMRREVDYYEGRRPRIVLPDRTLPTYNAVVDQARTPWASLVIDQAAERMTVTGFRVVTPDEADSDADADRLCWDVWQANQADAPSQSAFRAMLLHARAHILVEPVEGGLPRLSFEHPAVMAVHRSGGAGRTAAALKRWVDGDTEVAVLWDASGAVRLERSRRSGGDWAPSPSPVASVPGMVPVFEMANQPDLLGGARSDLDGLYPTLDRCAQSIADRITTQLFASTKVRYLIGVEPEYDEDGNPTQGTLKMQTDRLLLIENPEAKAGVFDASDLRQFIEVAKSDIAALAALSRLPTYLLSGDLVNVSREALESLSQGLVSRVEQRQVWASAALSDAMRTALLLLGDDRVADPRTRVEPIWKPVVEPSPAVTAQAAATLVQAGILSPTGAQDMVLGLTPSEREKAAQYTRADALTQQGVNTIADLLAAPEPPEAGAGAVG